MAARRRHRASMPWPGERARFKNYNVEAQCTPTRSAILSGRLPIRTGNCSVPLPGQGEHAIGEAGVSDNTIVVWNSDNPAGRAPYMGGFEQAVARSFSV